MNLPAYACDRRAVQLAAKISTQRVRKHKTDKQDAELLLRLRRQALSPGKLNGPAQRSMVQMAKYWPSFLRRGSLEYTREARRARVGLNCLGVLPHEKNPRPADGSRLPYPHSGL